MRTGTEVESWCSAFEKLCRSRGIRVTAQRLAVYRTLAEDLNHPTADSVYKQLKDRIPGMSHATVYRTLEFLERENLIRRVSAPAAVARFDANLEFHQHLSCRICGNLVDVSLPELAKPTLPTVSDFTVEELDIRLVGRCRRCASSVFKKRGRRPASASRNNKLHSKGREK